MERGRKITKQQNDKKNNGLKVPETINLGANLFEKTEKELNSGQPPSIDILPSGEVINKEIPKSNIFEEMEAKDEEQIRLIEGGMIVDEWFYALTEVPDPENPEETKIVYGISFVGTMALAREQKNLRVVGHPFPEHTADRWNYTITVEDTVRNVSTYGTSSESKFFTSKNGKTIFDNGQPKVNQFARISCLSKSQRNAFRKLLESERIENAFKDWYKKKYNEEANMKSIIIVSEYTKLDTFKNSSLSAK